MKKIDYTKLSGCCGAEILTVGGRSFQEFIVYDTREDFVAHYECSKCQQHLAFVLGLCRPFSVRLGRKNKVSMPKYKRVAQNNKE